MPRSEQSKERARKYGREYAQLHKEKRADYQRMWKAKNSNYHRNKHLQKKYGITEDQYFALLLEQNGVCAACQRPGNQRVDRTGRPLYRFLDVDHDHETGRVRGLLCNACNQALGFMRDDPLRLAALLTYLQSKSYGK